MSSFNYSAAETFVFGFFRLVFFFFHIVHSSHTRVTASLLFHLVFFFFFWWMTLVLLSWIKRDETRRKIEKTLLSGDRTAYTISVRCQWRNVELFSQSACRVSDTITIGKFIGVVIHLHTECVQPSALCYYANFSELESNNTSSALDC